MIENLINLRIKNVENLLNQKEDILNIKNIILNSLKQGGKILFFGNGGSASDSNHLACEFISKFKKERASIPAISLTSNNSILTAISNDYTFDDVFKRQLEGLLNSNDVAIGISTSGNSKNVLNGLNFAKENNIKTILFTGNNNANYNYSYVFKAPSNKTEQIQELHIMLGHIVCEIIEKELFN